ncbi:MAG: glycosyltransferase family 4 protein, partial [Cyanobacteria bacterium P01_F01_bin.33]
VKLVLVGDGPQAATLKSFYPPEYGVIWLGFIADEQRRIEILRGADVFILPSLIEGLSLSLLEAMACGVAVLATDVGADGEALEGGAGIRLAPHKVANALATLLPMLCEHPDFVLMLRRQARLRAIARYMLSRNIDRVEALYAELLGLNAQQFALGAIGRH